jgi:phosphopantetheinyl transferase
LIGKENEILLDTLLDASDSIDCAGTRIWSVKEAAKKATGQDMFPDGNFQNG